MPETIGTLRFSLKVRAAHFEVWASEEEDDEAELGLEPPSQRKLGFRAWEFRIATEVEGCGALFYLISDSECKVFCSWCL